MDKNIIELQKEKEVLNAIMRTDFYSFYRKFFIEYTGEAFDDSEVIKYLCDIAQQIADGNKKRIIINVPPRLGKSLIFSVALPAYILGRNPREKIIAVSYSQDLSKEFSSKCSKLMKMPFYKELFPETIIDSQKDTEEYFRTISGGYRFATSISGTLTGFGGNFILLDDPMKAQDALSEQKRTSHINGIVSTLFSRLDNKKEGSIVVIMQRLHLDDLTGFLEQAGGWEIISLPAIAETDEKHFFSDGRVFTRKPGEVLLPNREPLEILNEIRKYMNDYNFSAQYQQNPIPAKGNIIDFDNFARYDELPEDGKYIQSWDIAFKTGDKNDYSVCITAQLHKNKIYITDIYRDKLDFENLFAQITCKSILAKRCPVIIESTNSTLHLIEELKTRNLNIIPYQPRGSKEERAHNASFDIASGKVLLPREARWLEDFKREVITFPNGRHDDQVDALTQLILRSAFKSTHEKYMEAIDMLIEDQKSDEAKARRYYYMNRFKKFF